MYSQYRSVKDRFDSSPMYREEVTTRYYVKIANFGSKCRPLDEQDIDEFHIFVNSEPLMFKPLNAFESYVERNYLPEHQRPDHPLYLKRQAGAVIPNAEFLKQMNEVFTQVEAPRRARPPSRSRSVTNPVRTNSQGRRVQFVRDS